MDYTVVRLGAPKVVSLGQLAFARTHIKMLPAGQTSEGGYVFNATPIGAKQLAFFGDSVRSILEEMKARGKVKIYIDPNNSDMNDQVFRIYCALVEFEIAGEDKVIVDAGKMIIDQIGKSTITMASAMTGESALKEALSSAREAVQGTLEAKEAFSLKEVLAKIFKMTKGRKKVIGLVADYLAIDGGLDTHRKSISLDELAKLF